MNELQKQGATLPAALRSPTVKVIAGVIIGAALLVVVTVAVRLLLKNLSSKEY